MREPRFRWRLAGVRALASKQQLVVGVTWSRQVDLSGSEGRVVLWAWIWLFFGLGLALVFAREKRA